MLATQLLVQPPFEKILDPPLSLKNIDVTSTQEFDSLTLRWLKFFTLKNLSVG